MQVKCETCGKLFQAYPSRIPKSCSLACRDEGKTRIQTCEYCGKDFRVFRSTWEKRNPRFCSNACSAENRKRPAEERFWNMVEKTDSCWLWKSSKDNQSYGNFQVESGVHTRPYRYSWELHRGPIPKGLFVCHNCPGGDNPACVNPDHLFLGTHLDNMSDCAKKGRVANTKFNPKEIIHIRELVFNEGKTRTEVAKLYSVSKSTIARIVKGVTWKHVPS